MYSSITKQFAWQFDLMLRLPLLSNLPVTPTPVWGFSFLSVTVINVFSLTGVFFMPLMKTQYMKYALTFFIALSVGVLYSTAILQLLPEVCQLFSSLSIHLSIAHKPLLFKNTNTKPESLFSSL